MNDLQLPDDYQNILEKINTYLPSASTDTENFNKSSSQFKTSILDVTDLTPINSARHLLAIIQRTRQALEEANIKVKRKKYEIEQLQKNTKSELDEIDIQEKKQEVANIEAYGRGAIRKLAHALDLYQNILNQLGKTHLTEEDYELDQARYHIMTAFNQALCAARSRGGLIDEGNHIYLFQLGINGAVAQQEITALLETEQEALNQGIAPSHEGIMIWLNRLADKYADNPEKYAQTRKLVTLNKNLLLSLECQ